jgi:HEAT repeat protein
VPFDTVPFDTVEAICDPKRCPTPQALEAAFRIAADKPELAAELAAALGVECGAGKLKLPVVERLLELLAAIAPADILYPTLRAAMAHDDAHVRSKAALLLSRKVDKPEVLAQLAGDGDARVRANTIQALWGHADAHSAAIFGKALEDLHHRVAANAAYALFLLDPEGHQPALQSERLKRFVKHPHPRFRRAGAWLLRKIGDPANLPVLQPLVEDKNAEVRASAFAALVALQQVAAKSGMAGR